MLANNFIIQHNNQNYQQFVYAENYPIQEFQMSDYELSELPREINPNLGDDPVALNNMKDILERTNLNVEAKEFVPSYLLNTNESSVTDIAIKDIFENTSSTSFEYFNEPLQNVESTNANLTKEKMEYVSEKGKSYNLSDSVEAPVFVPKSSNVNKNLKESSSCNNAELSLVNNSDLIDTTKDNIDENDQKSSKDSNEDNNKESHDKIIEKEGQPEGNFQKKSKMQYSQLFQNSACKFNESANKVKKGTNGKNKEKGSNFQSNESCNRLNERDSDKSINQNKENKDEYKKNSLKSPSFNKNKNQGNIEISEQKECIEMEECKLTKRSEKHTKVELSDKDDSKRKQSEITDAKSKSNEFDQTKVSEYKNEPVQNSKSDDKKLEKVIKNTSEVNDTLSKYKTKDKNLDSADKAPIQDELTKPRSQKKPLRPNKSFRDALFANKKNEKPRDLKQEKTSAKTTQQHLNNDDECKNKKSERQISGEYQRLNQEIKNKRSEKWSMPGHNIINLFDKQYVETDNEYKAFIQELEAGKMQTSVKIKELNKNLFEMSQEYSLAHCVAEDMRMSSGIAVSFKKTYNSVDHLLNSRQKPGGLAILKVDLKETTKFLYYLVTKKRSRDKPTYRNFWCSMQLLRNHVKKFNIKRLAVPRLGCGLDGLDWYTVKHMMEFLFKDVPLELVVCSFYPTEEALQKFHSSVNIHHKKEKLVNAKETVLLYFFSADAHVSEEMKELDEKYKFLKEFQRAPKNFGVTIKYQSNDSLLCGCVVKRTVGSSFDFRSFAKCLIEVDTLAKEKGYSSIAIQVIKDAEDDLLNQKIITIIFNYLNNVDVFIYSGEVSYET